MISPKAMVHGNAGGLRRILTPDRAIGITGDSGLDVRIVRRGLIK